MQLKVFGLACLLASLLTAHAQEWNLATAAAPYEGTTVQALFLDRPGYAAAIELIPEFEAQTGINVEWEILPYENSRERQVLDFATMSAEIDVVLIDVVWIGEFAEAGWVMPMSTFINNAELADPNLNLEGFFPLLLDSFGTWNNEVYGLPFDNYSGLLFYNECMLQEAGFDGPPSTWAELLNDYGPALTNDGQYAFALQSRRGETQSADSFMRVLWPFGGSLIDEETFEPNLLSDASQEGLQFRQDLMAYMPEGIVDYDHNEAVQALAQGNVAMITEWSSFFATLNDPESSTITDCLAVATEPSGPAGRKPALGGFSLGVNAFSSQDEQAAAWLLIQWLTSEELAKDYVLAGGVSGRTSVYEDPEIADQFAYVAPLVESWQEGVPFFRPRFPEWPELSEIVADFGTRMMLEQIGVDEGAEQLNARVRSVLEDAGYYSGEKDKLQ
ncbi:MAG: sugar ABC transporter substrate-binding protein [Deinococcota bacterium]